MLIEYCGSLACHHVAAMDVFMVIHGPWKTDLSQRQPAAHRAFSTLKLLRRNSVTQLFLTKPTRRDKLSNAGPAPYFKRLLVQGLSHQVSWAVFSTVSSSVAWERRRYNVETQIWLLSARIHSSWIDD